MTKPVNDGKLDKNAAKFTLTSLRDKENAFSSIQGLSGNSAGYVTNELHPTKVIGMWISAYQS